RAQERVEPGQHHVGSAGVEADPARLRFRRPQEGAEPAGIAVEGPTGQPRRQLEEPAPVVAHLLPRRPADEERPQERAHRAAVEGDPRCGEGIFQSGRLLDRRRPVRGQQPVVIGNGPLRPLPPLRPLRDYLSSFQTTLPPTMVMTAAPLRVHPANGVLRPLLWNRAGSTLRVRSRSRTVTSAGERGASVPPGRPKTRAGPVEKTATRRVSGMRPGPTRRSRHRLTAVSRPTTPNAASSYSTFLSSTVCGAWSVAMASIVPSRSASTTARRSASQRSGGFIFVDASYPESFTAWSVRRRWCGVASAVTRTPRAFPRRTASAPAAVLRWATCN